MASQLDFAAGTNFADDLVIDGRADGRAIDASADMHRGTVIAFVGMDFEARIAAGPGVLVVCRTAGRQLDEVADSALRKGYHGLVSFGVAGGLAPRLRAGDWVVASSIRDTHASRPTDEAWSRRLLGLIKGAVHAPILGVDTPVADPGHKHDLHLATGAAAVDMESHLVARVAARHRMAFAAIRVIVDPAHRAVPPAALLNMRPDGRADLAAVVRNILGRPSQIRTLARLTADAYAARAAMQRVRRQLGPHFALSDHS
jgi:hopanoid-associated phosphorylase